jgi:hypothetical protein
MKTARLSGLVLGALMTVMPGMAAAGPDCVCRHPGGETREGMTACIRTPAGMSLARCERVLNNTSWKILNLPCPEARKQKPMSLPG